MTRTAVTRSAGLVGAACVATLVAAGCAGVSHPPASDAAPPTIAAGDSTSSPTDGPSIPPGPGTTGDAGTPRCTDAALAVTLGSTRDTGDAGRHYAIVLVFTNTGATPCHLQGYPRVVAVDTAGQQSTQARLTTHGYAGGIAGPTPSVVALAPGGQASAMVEGSGVPTGPATRCPTYGSLLVAPPEETHAFPVAAGGSGCGGLEVHPVVAGTTGSRPAAG